MEVKALSLTSYRKRDDVVFVEDPSKPGWDDFPKPDKPDMDEEKKNKDENKQEHDQE